ncbi:MAG: response regulator transcription factor [Bacteroidales bacterium]|nr:response regulator transcription factor [Bacteroidales bacterium]
MLKIVVIDDEQDAIDLITGAIRQHCPDAEVVGNATNIDDAQIEIASRKPDVVFLDIAMPSGGGFELLNRIPVRDFEVIFVTAYNEHAIRAFRYSAIDYLLKPVDIAELIEAVNKAGRSHLRNERNLINGLLENLSNGFKKISIPTNSGFEFVVIDEIIRIEADRSYCCFYLTGKRKYLVSKCLNDYHNLLENNGFFRVHNSHLINLQHVKSYVRRDGGYVEMTDSAQVPLSRMKKSFFLHALKKHVI